jgi:23S rRNA pseudouridine955/2504/2580 synthase
MPANASTISSSRLKGVPKTLIYRILRKGEVRVNKGRIKPEYKLQAGDIVRVPPVRVPERDEPVPLAQGLLQRLEAAIVYEDKALIVINKPAGIVHGGSGLNFVIEAFRQLRPDAKELELVHRLDRDTSGLLMIAKKRSMLRHLHAALRGDGVDKRYMALVRGHWPTSIKQVNAPLLKSNLRSGERMVEVNEEGKEALTLFKVLRRFGDFATLSRPSRSPVVPTRSACTPCTPGMHRRRQQVRRRRFQPRNSRSGRQAPVPACLHADRAAARWRRAEAEAPVDEMWAKTVERLSAPMITSC